MAPAGRRQQWGCPADVDCTCDVIVPLFTLECDVPVRYIMGVAALTIPNSIHQPFFLSSSTGQTDRHTDQSYGTMRHVRLEIGEILHIFPLAPKVWEIGDPKRLTRVRGQVYTCRPNLVVIDQSW